jgi:nitrate reductase NapE component
MVKARTSRATRPAPAFLVTSILLAIVLVVVAVMTVLWAFGRVLWWLRITFPPRPRPRRRR